MNVNCELHGSTSGTKYEKKAKYIFKTNLLFSHTCKEKTKYMVIISMKLSTKLVNSTVNWSGV